MRILSVDPGFTTGIAIFIDGELDASITVTRKGLHRNGFLNDLVRMSKPEKVLIEGLPTNLVSSEMARLHGYISNWFQIAGFDVEIIKPSQWKGLAERVEIPGQHARDAATMAQWWMRSKGMEIVKDA